MGLFTRRRPPALELTPEAVAAVLITFGFPRAEVDYDSRRLVSPGFGVHVIPVAHEDRVGVEWHADGFPRADRRLAEADFLVTMSAALEQSGYQAEIVDELTDSYLVVWVEGEF